MNKSPSIPRIVLIDLLAFIYAIVPLIALGMYLFVFRKDNNIFLPIICATISLASLLLLVWRIIQISTILNDNQHADAIISQVSFYRDRGRISYIYEYQGNKYLSGNNVEKTPWTKVYYEGQPVVVMVDRNNPKRAFIRDLYSTGK